MTLIIDSREPPSALKMFAEIQKKHPELEIEVKALPVGDYSSKYMVIERKELDDLISSFTKRVVRKDGTTYNRFESQLKRLVDVDKPTKTVFIHGSMKDKYSKVHPNAVRGVVAKFIANDISVIWEEACGDWADQIYRIYIKDEKYQSAE